MVINELRLNPEQDTLAHLLNRKGYTCDYIANGICGPTRQGVTSSRRTPTARRPLSSGLQWILGAYNFNHGNYNAFYFRDQPQRKEIDGWGPAHFTDLAIQRIEHHADTKQPFAMVVSYSPPHDPWKRDNVPPCVTTAFRT